MSSSKSNFTSPGYSPEAWRNLSCQKRNQVVMELIDKQLQKAEPLLLPPLLIAEDLVNETKFLIPNFVFPRNRRNIKKSNTNLFQGATRTEEVDCTANDESETPVIEVNFKGEERKENDSRESGKSSDDDNEDSTTKIVKLLENDIDTICRRSEPSCVREYHFLDCFKPAAKLSNKEATVTTLSERINKSHIQDESLKVLDELQKDPESFSNTSIGAHITSRSKSVASVQNDTIPEQKIKQLKPKRVIKRKSTLSKGVHLRIKSGRPQSFNKERKSLYVRLPPISQRIKRVDTDKNREICHPLRKCNKTLRDNDELRNQLVLPVICPGMFSPPCTKGKLNSIKTRVDIGRFGKKSPLLDDNEMGKSMSAHLKSKKNLMFQAAVSSPDVQDDRELKDSFGSVLKLERLPKHLTSLSQQMISAETVIIPAKPHERVLVVSTYKGRRKLLDPILTGVNHFSCSSSPS